MVRFSCRVIANALAGAALLTCAGLRADFPTSTAALHGVSARPLHVDPEAAKALDDVRAAAREHRWAHAASLYKQFVSRYAFSLVATGPYCYENARDLAAAMAREWPVEVQAELSDAAASTDQQNQQPVRAPVLSQPILARWPGDTCIPVSATSPASQSVCSLWQRTLHEMNADTSSGRETQPVCLRIISVLATERHLLLQTRSQLIALDADTGRQKWLWEVNGLDHHGPQGHQHMISLPLLTDDGLYIAVAEHVPWSGMRVGLGRIDQRTGRPIWNIALFAINETPTEDYMAARLTPQAGEGQLVMSTCWGGKAHVQAADGHIVRTCTAPSYRDTGLATTQPAPVFPEKCGLNIGMGRVLVLDGARLTCTAEMQTALDLIQQRLAAEANDCMAHLALLRVRHQAGCSTAEAKQLVEGLLRCLGREPDNLDPWSQWLDWLCEEHRDGLLRSVFPDLTGSLDEAAQWPTQQAQWRLMLARRFDEMEASSEAITCLQQILERDELRTAALQPADIDRDSGSEAKRMLGDLLRRRPDQDLGDAVMRAEKLLEQSWAAEDTRGLRAVMERYPFTSAAGKACRKWAELARQQQPLHAAIILEQGYRDCAELRDPRTVEAIHAAYQEAGRYGAGLRWLTSIGLCASPTQPCESTPALPRRKIALRMPLAEMPARSATLLAGEDGYGEACQLELLFHEHQVSALDARNGSIAWSFPWRWNHMPMWSAPLACQWLLASRDTMTCLDGFSGQVAWSRRSGKETEDLPNVTTSAQPLPMQAFWPSLLIRVHDKNEAVAIATLDGRVLWRRRLAHPCQSGLTVDPWHFAYITQAEAGYQIVVADAGTGEETALADWIATGRPDWLGFLSSGALLAVGSDLAVAYDPKLGSVLWKQARLIHTPAGILVGTQAVYLPCNDGSVEALALNDGSSLWRRETLPGSQPRRMLGDVDAICVVDARSAVVLVAKDGRVAARSTLSPDQSIEAVAWTAEQLLVVSSEPDADARVLKLLALDRGSSPAQSSFHVLAVLGRAKDVRAVQFGSTALFVQDGDQVRVWQ